MLIRSAVSALTIVLLSLPTSVQAETKNQLVGAWRMVSATIDPGGRKIPAYGETPHGLLVFTSDMHFVEVLTDGSAPRFASDARGEGTDEENRRAMSRSIGFFGTYTVDDEGAFSGNRVDGATFPNWVGSTRTREQLTLTVVGDRMTEHFQRPEGTRVQIEWRRVERGR